jgi:hypothetical protein
LSLGVLDDRLTKRLFVFVVYYGVLTGAIISLLPTCLSEIFGIKNYRSSSGFREIGNFLASITGILISQRKSPRDYQNCIVYNGCLLGASTLLLGGLNARVKKTLNETAEEYSSNS